MLSLKISQKLMLLVFITLFAFAISQGYSLLVERANAARLQNVEQRLYPTLELTTINLGSLLLMEQQFNSAVTTADDQALVAAEQHYKNIRDNFNKISGLSSELKSQTVDIEEQLVLWHDTAVRIARSFIDGSVDMGKVGAEAASNADRLSSLKKSLETMKEQTKASFVSSISDTVQESESANTVSRFIAVFAVIGLIIFSLMLSRSITASINKISVSLHEMASGAGDLTVRIEYRGKDEIRALVDNFNKFIGKLHSSFADVSRDVGGLGQVATRLTRSSGENLQKNNAQSQAIGDMRTSIEELMRSVKEVAHYASNASVQTTSARDAAAQGKTTLATNVATISALANEVHSAANIVNRFESFSTDVGQLLNTIQNVAEQTNLLALNAAIEAARAGEHGRGFAVVADEVRGLAVRTRQATEEIHKVIGELRQVSESAVTAMQGSVERANSGVDATNASGAVLASILTNVEAISSINEQIAAATSEQSQTFNDVIQHVTAIHHNTETLTESTSDLNSVSHDIENIVQGLRRISAQFKV
ncbi:MAG TPA: methyl-accepting chemotaxis protein [Cellvibrio sp.]|nr:methyl-accepting chemotaxis protein [Cellvibrio sp.]